MIFWLGVPALSVVLGNVWRALSPWRAIADAFVWVRERAGQEAQPLADYPERLGRWPGAVVLFAFVSLELAYADPASPRALAFAIALYTYIALFGMASFGRETWERNGEGFAVLFRLFSRIAPLHAVDGRIRVRWPLTGLAGAEPAPGTLAFVAVMLGSVLVRRLQPHHDVAGPRREVEGPYVVDQPGLGELLVTLRASEGCCSRVLVVALAYAAACAVARWSVNAPRSLEGSFSARSCRSRSSTSSRTTSRCSSRRGSSRSPPLGSAGQGLGPVRDRRLRAEPRRRVAEHDVVRAGRSARRRSRRRSRGRPRPGRHDLPGARGALRSQYAMLALMVLYTVGGLWVLSRG